MLDALIGRDWFRPFYSTTPADVPENAVHNTQGLSKASHDRAAIIVPHRLRARSELRVSPFIDWKGYALL